MLARAGLIWLTREEEKVGGGGGRKGWMMNTRMENMRRRRNVRWEISGGGEGDGWERGGFR